MPASLPPSGQEGIIPLEWIRLIDEGMTPEQVLEHLGPPAARLNRKGVTTPSEVFASFGSTLSFPGDRGLKEVWVYVHDRRGKFLLHGQRIETFIGFRGGIVTIAWQDQTKLAESPEAATGGESA